MLQMPQTRTCAEILPIKWEVAAVAGQTAAMTEQCPKNKTNSSVAGRLLGEVNESEIQINGKSCTALLDTGSMVSTVSRTFYDSHLNDTPLHPLQDILNIECAGGQLLPYDGYIEADLSLVDQKGEETGLTFLLLVVPETDYNTDVPVLLGTNALRPLMESYKDSHGTQFLQKADLGTPYYLAFRCMSVRDRELRRTEGRIGLVKCAAAQAILIPPNRRVTVPGVISDRVQVGETSILMQETKKTALPEGIEIMPTLHSIGDGVTEVMIEIANPTNTPIVIQPRSLLCEMQQIDVQEDQEKQPGMSNQQVSNSEATETEGPSEPVSAAKDSTTMTDQEFLDQFHLQETELTQEQVGQVGSLLLEYKDVFSMAEFDIGRTTTIKHRIDLHNEVPFKQRHRRVPPAMFDEVRNHLKQLKEVGIIQESSSPWASPVVLVRKSNGALRFCVDYRMLNQRTIKDAYALPRIDELIDHFAGCTFFSSLDLRMGFYQVEMEEQHKERTAFTVGPLGFYEFCSMPFGLSNSPATFQRLMEYAMGDLHMKECFSFIDDMLVPSTNFDQGLVRLEHVFRKLREHHLKMNPAKCTLFGRRVVYCGHVISEDGVETDPKKTEKIANWPEPEDATKVREFLGFAGYYRRYVRGFSTIAKPLLELTGGTNIKKSKMRKKTTENQPEWKWGKEQQDAFDQLKACLTSPPILAYPDYSKPFVLHTDACINGLGAVLSQKSDEGKENVISYASRGVSRSERNYPAHKLEFLALKWAVTDKFKDYLYGHDFTVYTDNNPLTYAFTTAKLDATGHRWLAALATYRFDIKYRPGRSNANADILSRLPKGEDQDAEDYEVIKSESIGAICHQSSTRVPWVETVCMSAEAINIDDLNGDTTVGLRELRKSQRDDPSIGPIVQAHSQGNRPRLGNLQVGSEQYLLAKEFDKMTLRRGLLYRVTTIEGEKKMQIVLPKCYRKLVLTGCHDDVGHQGRDRTLSLVRDRYFWPRMSQDVETKLKQCP